MNESNAGSVGYNQGELLAIQKREFSPERVGASSGLDYFGLCLPRNGDIGGDRLDVIDFGRVYRHDRLIRSAREQGREHVVPRLEKNKSLIGALITDTSGHGILADLEIPSRIHGAVYSGISYELQAHGHVTTDLFERVNHDCFDQWPGKFTTCLYCEVSGEDGSGRFISAGNPFPLIVKADGNIDEKITNDWEESFPFGVLPSIACVYKHIANYDGVQKKERYKVNNFKLERGDSAFFFSDWFFEHGKSLETKGRELYRKLPRFRDLVHKNAGKPIMEFVTAVTEDAIEYAPTSDDLTILGIKRD